MGLNRWMGLDDGVTDSWGVRVVMYCDMGEWLEWFGVWEELFDEVV